MSEIVIPPLSASSLKTFNQCPGKFEFDKLTDIEGQESENKYTIAGSAIHEAIEETLRMLDEPSNAGENELAHLFKSEFEVDPRKDELDESMRKRAMSSLQTAARYLAAQSELEILGIEDSFHVEIDELPFRGYMDLTTEYSVIDWKSGRLPGSDDMGEKLQGMVYWQGYKERYGKEPEAVRFVYLKEGKERVYSDKGDDYNDMIATVRDLRRAAQGNSFEYNPGDQCYWCEFENSCPASPVGAGGIRYEVF